MIGYSSKTLNDNWFEDRFQPKFPEQTREVRTHEPGLDVTRMSRKKQNPTWALPDDGFERYQISKTHEEYPCPESIKETVSESQAPSSVRHITSETIPEMCYEKRRPVNDVPKSGFRAVLSRHHPSQDPIIAGQDKSMWRTATREAFEYQQVSKDFIETMKEKGDIIPAGYKPREAAERPGALVGENVHLCDIPCQRSWMAVTDPGLREYTRTGGVNPEIPKEDNELSIPIGEGCQKQIQASLEARGGKLYKTKTSITTGKQCGFTKNEVSVFDDYP